MSASRWFRPITTRRCMAPICCGNPDPASRASDVRPFDVFLAVMVAVVWGLAFVASRLALDELSPALMTAMRFAMAALPCLFVRRPNVSWTALVAISGTLFLGQFLAQSWAI